MEHLTMNPYFSRKGGLPFIILLPRRIQSLLRNNYALLPQSATTIFLPRQASRAGTLLYCCFGLRSSRHIYTTKVRTICYAMLPGPVLSFHPSFRFFVKPFLSTFIGWTEGSLILYCCCYLYYDYHRRCLEYCIFYFAPSFPTHITFHLLGYSGEAVPCQFLSLSNIHL